MRILVVGDDARAHVAAEKLSRSAEVYSLMEKENPAISRIAQKRFICDFSNIEAIGDWAIKQRIDFAFVIEEKALSLGLVDTLADAEIVSASPTMAAAAIGDSRSYARSIMKVSGIFPEYSVCTNEKEVMRAVKDFGVAVIKPNTRSDWRGLAISSSFAQKAALQRHAKKLLKGKHIVIVERLIGGEEFTLQAFCDGVRTSIMPPVRTSNYSLEMEKGVLCEGMGSYSTGLLLPFLKKNELEQGKAILQKVVSELRNRGVAFKGILAARLIATGAGIKLLDLGNSVGNPEILNALPNMRTEFAEVLLSIAEGRLIAPSFHERATVVKYIVPSPYPKKSGKKKRPISLNEKIVWDNGSAYYVNSLEMRKGKLFLTDERALALVAHGKTLEEADRKVEDAAAAVSGTVRHRADIGKSEYVKAAIARMQKLRSFAQKMQNV